MEGRYTTSENMEEHVTVRNIMTRDVVTVHEDDLIELFATLITRPVPGIFNVANDGEIKYSEIAKLLCRNHSHLLLPTLMRGSM